MTKQVAMRRPLFRMRWWLLCKIMPLRRTLIRVREELRSAAFLAAFLEKGRMRSWMERIPVRIIERDDAGIIGAALASLPPSVRATVREIPEAAPIP